jgi:S-adenosylhomocysteine hydrolase
MTAPPTRIETSLGPALVLVDDEWQLDLAELPVLHGLSVLSRALAEMALGQVRSDRVDVAVERKLRPRENPELIERLRLDHVKVDAEQATIESCPHLLETRLRALLGSLQRQRYREALFPADAAPPRALVAEFDDGVRQRYVLEHVVSRRDAGRGALRITVEGAGGRRLDLGALPHVRIGDVADRHFIAGSTRIAQTWTEALRRECARGRRSFFEARDPHSHLFQQLDQAGLGSLQRVSLQWAETALPFLLEGEPAATSELLKRVLLALEDRGVRRLLSERAVVRVDGGGVPVFLDISQLGRVLELSLGQRRQRADADAFLQRMPVLGDIVARHRGAAPLRSVPVFLVHHMTGEVVGLIAALRALGCRDLCCVFVTYAGEPPASYLDAVLDLPTDEFRALALVNVPHRGSVEGTYRLSRHYSQLDEAEAIVRALQGRDAHFVDAMRAIAVVPFLRQVARAEAAGQRCLLVEDGGYLAPVLHDALLRAQTAAQFAAALGYDGGDARPLADAVGRHLLGTVEHTRNGFDRLTEVQRRNGRLALPAWSIAISRLKRDVESREVAASVLGAVEAVLNADGRVLARRSCLVLGSRGAIGRELCSALRARLDAPDRALCGVDLAAAPAGAFAEGRTLADLGDRWLDVDVVLGVTGDSVLGGADLERWLCDGRRDVLVLASGSTKKVEFRALMEWFEGLLRSDAPCLRGRPIEVRVEELLDPRTARVYGHRWLFDAADGRRRTVLALGNLSPINFLFYGVATELIDEVLAQLLSLSLAAVRRARAGDAPAQLSAVDRDVDADGLPLQPAPADPARR